MAPLKLFIKSFSVHSTTRSITWVLSPIFSPAAQLFLDFRIVRWPTTFVFVGISGSNSLPSLMSFRYGASSLLTQVLNEFSFILQCIFIAFPLWIKITSTEASCKRQITRFLYRKIKSSVVPFRFWQKIDLNEKLNQIYNGLPLPFWTKPRNHARCPPHHSFTNFL